MTSDDADLIEGRSYRTSILYWVGILDKMINAQFAIEMKESKSVVGRWRTLSVLAINDGLLITQLANETFIERTALSRLLDLMEHEGLLRRKPRAEDRRNIEVYITRKGREMFARMLPVRRAIFRRAARGMDDEQLQALMHSVRLLVHNLADEMELQPPASGAAKHTV